MNLSLNWRCFPCCIITSYYGLRPIWPKANIYASEFMAYCQIMAQKSDSRDLDKVIVRLPDGMRDRIKIAAIHNNRSMNAEIVQALDYWLEVELPYDVELGNSEDAKAVGRRDWEQINSDRENYYRKELERSLYLIQDLLRELKFVRPKEPGTDEES